MIGPGASAIYIQAISPSNYRLHQILKEKILKTPKPVPSTSWFESDICVLVGTL